MFHASGTIWIDCVQLEEGDTSNSINLIDNSSFEINNNSIGSTPTTWSATYTDSLSGLTKTAVHDGQWAHKIRGDSKVNRILHKTLPQKGKKGDVYAFGAWAKANAIPDKTSTPNFRLVARFGYSDNTEEWIDVPYNNFVSGWQFTMKNIIARKDYKEIQIYLCYYKNCNEAIFDSVFLFKDTAQSYVYDNDGNVISAVDNANTQSNFSYKNNQLANLLNPSGSSYIYSYDNKNNLIYSKSNTQHYSIKYDNYGNPINTITTSAEPVTNVEIGKKYLIVNAKSGKILQAPGDIGTKIVTGTYTPDSNGYLWETVNPFTDQRLSLKSVRSDSQILLIQDYCTTKTVGSQLSLQSNGGYGPHESFYWELNTNNTFTLIFQQSADLAVGEGTDSKVVIQKTNRTDPAQQWYFYEYGDFIYDADLSRESYNTPDIRNKTDKIESDVPYYIYNAFGTYAYIDAAAYYQRIKLGIPTTKDRKLAVWYLTEIKMKYG